MQSYLYFPTAISNAGPFEKKYYVNATIVHLITILYLIIT